MPYIEQRRREELTESKVISVGELNYMVTRLVNEYINKFGLSYQHINDVVGVLECAKLELYRRVAIPYENEKMRTNGDVYHDKK